MQAREQQLHWIAALLFLAFALPALAAEHVPTLVEVYWKSSRAIEVPGAYKVLVLDPDLVGLEAQGESIRFYGIKRGGETIAIVYTGEQPISIRVRVIDPPAEAPAPRMPGLDADLAHATITSSVQMASAATSPNQVGIFNGINWAQALDGNRRLEFSSDTAGGSTVGASNFTVRRAALGLYAPDHEIHLFDFSANLLGTPLSAVSSSYSTEFIDLRGAAVGLRTGNTSLRFFAGTTIPLEFLSLRSMSDVAGMNFEHQQTKNLTLFGGTTLLKTPNCLLGLTCTKQDSAVEDFGAAYHAGHLWSASAIAAASTHGASGRGEFHLSTAQMTLLAEAKMSAPQFPLNNLLSTFSGTSALHVNWSYRNTSRLTETLSYDRATTRDVPGLVAAGKSEYVSPGVDFRLNSSQDVNLAYVHSRTSGGFLSAQTTGNRFDTYWNWRMSSQMSNALEVSVGSLQDPLQLSSEDHFRIRDSLTFSVPRGNMTLAFSEERHNPSLVERLNSELGLLTPALQEIFQHDPVGFVTSGALPPEIHALLDAQRTTGTYFSASAQLQLTRTLMASPNISFSRSTGLLTGGWSPSFGYGLHWQATPTLQLQSSLSNVWYLNTRAQAQRTTVFSLGVVKDVYFAPSALLPKGRGRTIQGRVFRDNNINGTYNDGEPGMAGVRVQIDEGESVTTDAAGRYRFSGISPGIHRVSVNLADFKNAARMTSATRVAANLLHSREAEVNFGVVDFARVIGRVYNDAQFASKRRADSKGLPGVRLLLQNGAEERVFTSDGTGDFRLNDVAPGDYTLAVDVSSLPPNYSAAAVSFPIHVAAVSTAMCDVPVRALRSVGGHIMLKMPESKDKKPGKASESYLLMPVEGATIVAGSTQTKSAADGSFLLRNLPAGEMTVTLAAVKELPAGMALPTGRVALPESPIEIHDATIVISNPALIPYLVDSVARDGANSSR